MKILLVEEGDYSDRTWTPLAVPDDFDAEEARRDFISHVKRTTEPREVKHAYPHWEIRPKADVSLAGWLQETYRVVRPPNETEFATIYDPIHYGRLEGD